MNEAWAPAQWRSTGRLREAKSLLPDPDTLAEKLAAIVGGAPDRALAERLLALCRAQLAAARPALDRVDAADTPEQHMAVLLELVRNG
jgi:hypothetical protein